jgi:hypothetical protein
VIFYVNNFTNRQKSYTIFVVCRNTIWTAWLVMDLTKMCVFHFMIFTVMTDFWNTWWQFLIILKTSTLLDDIEQSLTNIKYNIANVLTHQAQNMLEIQQQRQIFHDQVKQMRVKINSHFDDIADIISVIFSSMLHFKLSCCRHPSSDKAIMYFSSFFTSSSIALLPRKVCRSEAYSSRQLLSRQWSLNRHRLCLLYNLRL